VRLESFLSRKIEKELDLNSTFSIALWIHLPDFKSLSNDEMPIKYGIGGGCFLSKFFQSLFKFIQVYSGDIWLERPVKENES